MRFRESVNSPRLPYENTGKQRDIQPLLEINTGKRISENWNSYPDNN